MKLKFTMKSKWLLWSHWLLWKLRFSSYRFREDFFKKFYCIHIRKIIVPQGGANFDQREIVWTILYRGPLDDAIYKILKLYKSPVALEKKTNCDYKSSPCHFMTGELKIVEHSKLRARKNMHISKFELMYNLILGKRL
jgi:hypothetical protein